MRLDLSPLAAVTILLALAIVYGNDYLVTLTDGVASPANAISFTMDAQPKEIRQ